MKLKLSSLFIIVSFATYSQVGINTPIPSTTFDISPKRDNKGIIIDNNQTLGFQAPRITLAELTSNTANYGANQRGAILYITSIVGGNNLGQREKIKEVGYYYFDGLIWQKFSGALFEEVDGVVGNEVVNATANKGLVRSGSGTQESPYTLGLMNGSSNGEILRWDNNNASWKPSQIIDQNIYDSDGILAGNRIVNLEDKKLQFTSSANSGTGHFSIDGSTFTVDAVKNRVGLNVITPTEVLDIAGNARVRELPKAVNFDDYPRTVVAKTSGELAYSDVVNSGKQIYTADVADATKTVKLGHFEFRFKDQPVNPPSLYNISLAEFRLTSNPGKEIKVIFHLEEKWNNRNNNENSGNGSYRFITLEKTFNTTNWNTWSVFNGKAVNDEFSANTMTEFSAKSISMQYDTDTSLYVVDYKIIDIPGPPETYSIIVHKY